MRYRATAAAPTSGASPPKPAGRIRAPREKSRRARASISAWAAAKKGFPKPRATEPATTASRRSSRLATEATARPTSVPVRSTISGGASTGGRPVMAAMARPDASPSRQPRPAAEAGAAAGPDDDVADVAGVARQPVEQTPVEHDAPSDPSRYDHPHVGAYPGGGSDPPLGEGDGLGVVVDEDRQAGRLGHPPPEREAPPGRDVHRGQLLTAGGHRPARPDAAHLGGGALRPELVEQADQRAEDDLGVVGAGRGDGGPGEQPPVGRVDETGGELRPADVDGQHSDTTGHLFRVGVTGPRGGSVRSRAVRDSRVAAERFVSWVRLAIATSMAVVVAFAGRRRRALSRGGLDRARGGHRVRMARVSSRRPVTPVGARRTCGRPGR